MLVGSRGCAGRGGEARSRLNCVFMEPEKMRKRGRESAC